ncbi:MAG: putative inorganic carbon transporter subunit DabA, partial [Flavobacteriales bacterium]
MHPTSENHLSFNLSHVLEELSHQLPAQAPLKDFIHHNTLHAFQYLPFKEGIRKASRRFGYRVLLPLKEYRQSYNAGRINHDILVRTVQEHKGLEQLGAWVDRMVTQSFEIPEPPRIGMLRGLWKRRYKIDIDSLVHPILFRILCNYLDQGISIWQFPEKDKGFLEALRAMERNSAVSLFRTKRGRALFLNKETNIEELLSQLVDGPNRYAQYLFDQQFAHQGWSGMVATVEHQPFTLLDKRDIKLEELIFLELVLEIDALEYRLGNNWKPLPKKLIRYVP